MMSLIEGGDTDGITSGDESSGSDGLIEQDEGEHSVEERTEFRAMFTVLYTDSEKVRLKDECVCGMNGNQECFRISTG